MDRFSQKALLNNLKAHGVFATFQSYYEKSLSCDDFSFINFAFEHNGFNFSLFPDSIPLKDGKPHDLNETINEIVYKINNFKNILDLYIFETRLPETGISFEDKCSKLFELIENQSFHLFPLGIGEFSFMCVGGREDTLANIADTLQKPLNNGASLLNCYLLLMEADINYPNVCFYKSLKDRSAHKFNGLNDFVCI